MDLGSARILWILWLLLLLGPWVDPCIFKPFSDFRLLRGNIICHKAIALLDETATWVYSDMELNVLSGRVERCSSSGVNSNDSSGGPLILNRSYDVSL